ncbi:lipase secretion chaperone [Allohahella sp. A8]|uniref:lipase secretion chaperone n=1 Tax=Allohahella sp. A8 TaxID=3141461 RepID=UPI003A7FCD8C
MRLPTWFPAMGLAVVTFTFAALALYLAQLRQAPDTIHHDLWEQPAEVAAQRPVAPTSWSFDFAPISAILQNVRVDEQGRLVLEPYLARVLEGATSILPTDLDDANLERLAQLIDIEMPGLAGETLSKLLVNHYRYRQAANAAGQASAATDSRATLENDIALKRTFFDEATVQAVFGKGIMLKSYLLARRAVNEDDALDEKQKKLRLAELSARYNQILPSQD